MYIYNYDNETRYDLPKLRMRFVHFIRNGTRCIGVELKQGGDIVNLTASDTAFPGDLRSYIEKENALKTNLIR